MADSSRLIPAPEAARLAHVSTKTLQRLRTRGEGPPYYRLGRRVLYHPDEINSWVQSQRVTPGPRQQAQEAPEWAGPRPPKTASAARPPRVQTAPSERALRGTRTAVSAESRSAEAHANEIGAALGLSPLPGTPSDSPTRLQLVTDGEG